MDPLAISGDEVNSLSDRLLDPEGAAPARELRLALEHVDGAQVERGLRPFGIQEPGVAGRQRLVERLVARFHAVILMAAVNADVARAAELRSAGGRALGHPCHVGRWDDLSRLVEAGIDASVGMAPILPGLSDRPELLAEVVREARAAGATGIWANLLYLRAGTRDHFLAALERDWPELLPDYEQLYRRGAYLPRDVTEPVRKRVRALARSQGVRDRRCVRLEPPKPAEQLELAM